MLQAGRFMLGAQELQLPVAATAPLSTRLEALRQLLRQQLGPDIFQRWAPLVMLLWCLLLPSHSISADKHLLQRVLLC